ESVAAAIRRTARGRGGVGELWLARRRSRRGRPAAEAPCHGPVDCGNGACARCQPVHQERSRLRGPRRPRRHRRGLTNRVGRQLAASRIRARRVFVWTWLPDESAPVVAGAVDRVGADRLDFTYARSYLENEKAISLYAPELPLHRGAQEPLDGLTV